MVDAKGRYIPKTEEDIKEIINNKYPKFKYIGGYTGSEGKLILRCKRCGYEFEYTSQMLRPSKEYNIQCLECNIKDKERNTKEKELEAIREKKEREEAKRIEREETELKRKEKLSNRICSECGQTFNAKRTSQKYCSNECAKKHENRIKEISRRKKLKSNGKIQWDITLDKLIIRDKNVCHICGNKCNKKDYEVINNNFIVGKDYPSIDHIKPVSKGGTHTWDNIKLAHHYCNTIKNDNAVYEDGSGQLTMAI